MESRVAAGEGGRGGGRGPCLSPHGWRASQVGAEELLDLISVL